MTIGVYERLDLGLAIFLVLEQFVKEGLGVSFATRSLFHLGEIAHVILRARQPLLKLDEPTARLRLLAEFLGIGAECKCKFKNDLQLWVLLNEFALLCLQLLFM